MKKGLIVVLLIAIVVGFMNYKSRQTQNELMKKELAELRKQNDILANRANATPTTEPRAAQQLKSRAERIQMIQTQIDAEKRKLADFQQRKDNFNSAISDPAKASTLTEATEEIRQKNEQIQSLQMQLQQNQNYERNLDREGTRAQEGQNYSKAAATADINGRIRAQKELIKNTQASIQANQIAATGDSMAAASAMVPALRQQKNDLQTLYSMRDQINVATAGQLAQIHQQLGYEKGEVHASQQEIRAQISQVQSDIKALQSQSGSVNKTTQQLKQQLVTLNQQIDASKQNLTHLQQLLTAEQSSP